MKFLSTRELRNRPGAIREILKEGDVALTANGKPFAIVVGVEEGDLERTATVIRRARAQVAVSRMRRAATDASVGALSPEQIEVEVSAVRAKRSRG